MKLQFSYNSQPSQPAGTTLQAHIALIFQMVPFRIFAGKTMQTLKALHCGRSIPGIQRSLLHVISYKCLRRKLYFNKLYFNLYRGVC